MEFHDVRLEEMQERREHARICINLMENDPKAKPNLLADALKELLELEQDIARHRPLRA